jgi:hypothetical protein
LAAGGLSGNERFKMKKVNKIDIETYEKALNIQRIGNLAVHKAQEENRRLGLPNVYSRSGKIIFEMPNGEIVVKNDGDEMVKEEL